MTAQATIVAHSGNKKLIVQYQALHICGDTGKETWVVKEECELDPRTYGQTNKLVYGGMRVVIMETGDFLN